jgi:hypothetical protein
MNTETKRRYKIEQIRKDNPKISIVKLKEELQKEGFTVKSRQTLYDDIEYLKTHDLSKDTSRGLRLEETLVKIEAHLQEAQDQYDSALDNDSKLSWHKRVQDTLKLKKDTERSLDELRVLDKKVNQEHIIYNVSIGQPRLIDPKDAAKKIESK